MDKMEEGTKEQIKHCKYVYKIGIIAFIVILLAIGMDVYGGNSIIHIIIKIFSLTMIFCSMRSIKGTIKKLNKMLKEINYGGN